MSALTAAVPKAYNTCMITTANIEKCRARHPAGGFTMVELLTVIMIIAILMAMLAPSVAAVFFVVRKEICKNNLHSIVSAANRYAHADAKLRLPTIWSKTNRTPVNTWGNMKTGNPACLALLIDAKLADRELFLCPEARLTRGFVPMPMDANYFTYQPQSTTPPPPTGISTLSYSYISMVYNPDWSTTAAPEGNVAAFMTMDRAPATLVVLADQNPRCVFGTTNSTPKLYTGLTDLSGTVLTTALQRNSLNHYNKGQNVARWDASVKWITDANNPNSPEDDIYSSACGINSADEKLGRRKDINDSFLIP